MNTEGAAEILATGKRLAPDRFPQPSPETAEVWAIALSEVDFPRALWGEAVILWATKLVGDRMVTPRDLIGAAYSVRDRWETDPEKSRVLDELRAARASANYARMGLEPITPADLPRYGGYPPKAVTERSGRQQSQPERMSAPDFIKRSQA